MAQQGKPMRICARKGFAYNSAELVYWIVNGMRLHDSITYFQSRKTLNTFKIIPCSNSNLFRETFVYL
jgi:hypothetical protein